MTVDGGHGTVQMSGLYEDLMCECQLLAQRRLTSPSDGALSIILLSLRDRRTRLCLRVRSSRVTDTGRFLVIFMDLLS